MINTMEKMGSHILIKFLLAFLFSFPSLFAVHAQNLGSPVPVYLNADGLQINVTDPSENNCIIEYRIGEFFKIPVVINGEIFYSLNLPHESQLYNTGDPELPKISRSIRIPNSAKMDLIIMDTEYTELELKVLPSKGNLTRNINPTSIPYSFSSVYDQNSYYPGKLAELGSPYILRDYRGITVHIYPFQYNPVLQKLRIYTRLVVKIYNSGTDQVNIKSSSRMISNPYFEEIYNSQFLNYQPSAGLLSVQENGRMLIIAYDSLMTDMQPLVDWKNQRGLPTTMVSVTQAGSTATNIKNYLKTEYAKNDGLTYVLLVGDAAQLPTLTVSGGGSDPSYSLLDGTDSYPEVFVGRFSAVNSSQVKTQVERIIYYERDLNEQSWLHRAVLIGSSEGPGDMGEYDYQHERNIRTDLLNYHYTQGMELYDGSQGGQDAAGNPTAAMVTSALNEGCSIICYTGHGSNTAWGTTGYSVSQVNALQNDNKLPFILDVACLNGNFTSTTCFAEAWMRATNSSTGNPAGAIGIYASSINQAWNPPMYAQDAMVDLLVSGQYKTFGGICYNGSCKMMDQYGTSGKEMFLTWNIFGDPSLKLIGKTNNTATPIPTGKTPSPTPAPTLTPTITPTATVLPTPTATSNGYPIISGNTTYEWIATVKIGSLNNTSGNNNGYGDFSQTVTAAAKGTVLTVTLTPGFTSSAYTEYWKIWLDLNHDDDFNDSNEELFSSSGNGTVSGNLTIPSSALTGNTRLRVAMRYNQAPASSGSLSFGEAEDYTFNITAVQPTQTPTIPPTVTPTPSLTPTPTQAAFIISYSPPPSGMIRTPAEFEPVEGVVLQWDYNYFRDNPQAQREYDGLHQFIVEKIQAAGAKAYILVDNQSTANQIANILTSVVNVEFIICATDTIWSRDYSANSIYYGDEKKAALVDWEYNRPRPNDDISPLKMADYLKRDIFIADEKSGSNKLIAPGGNFMTDGYGTAFSSKLILTENPTLGETGVKQIMKNYMGINSYILMNTLPYDEIHHLDMHMKLLDEETLLVGQYPSGVADGPQIEANLATILANYKTIYGTPFKVIRIPMPGNPSNGDKYRTYTNSLIINNYVLVPTFGIAQDSQALDIYRNAMPGYHVEGYYCDDIIVSLGAIHCIAHEINKPNVIQIKHQRVSGEIINGQTIQFRAEIWSPNPIIGAGVWIKMNGETQFKEYPMTINSGIYSVNIPASIPGTAQYYIKAISTATGGYKPQNAYDGGYYSLTIIDNATNFGDVDGNGVIDVVDALLIAQYSVDLNPPNFRPDAADVDCNDRIDILDSLLVAQYTVDLIVQFPCRH